MRFSPHAAANALAWAVVAALFCAAVVMVTVLGFVGLLILGVGTCLICILSELNQDAPTWGVEVFKARTGGGGSPEQRAAMLADRQTFLSPVRFHRNCGVVLVGLGAAGIAWQAWGS